jgi:MoaA/NifB/PqqE/SkfB family radical SAM enzyme
MPFERVANLLRDMAAMGTEEVWLAGRGEPLLHPKSKDILKLIGDLGMRSIITTNAAVLTDELADQLCDWNLQQLSISIDSGTPETYANVHGGPPEDRARILRLLRYLSQRQGRKPRLLVSMVFSHANFRELLPFVQDAIDAGVSGIVVGGMRPVPFDSTDLALSEEDWARVRADLKKARELTQAAGIDLTVDNVRTEERPRAGSWPYADMGCFIGHLFTVIDVHGDVHGCCTCQNKLGSLDQAPSQDVWHSRPYCQYRRILREMPSTGVTPPRCECRHGCGHIPENARLQQGLGFTFPESLPHSEFATRLDVAQAVCRHFDSILPPLARDYRFADLPSEHEQTASRMRQIGAMAGTGSMDGVSLFEPDRLVAREEFEILLGTVLVASGIGPDRADSAIGETRTGTADRAESIAKQDMHSWLSRLQSSLASDQGQA